jgi:hypothetical protein
LEVGYSLTPGGSEQEFFQASLLIGFNGAGNVSYGNSFSGSLEQGSHLFLFSI